jgi:hypothetical protein
MVGINGLEKKKTETTYNYKDQQQRKIIGIGLFLLQFCSFQYL